MNLLSLQSFSDPQDTPPIVYPVSVEDLHPRIRFAHRYFRTFVPPRHIFDHELIFTLDGGNSVYTIDNQSFSVDPGHLLFVPPFCRHSMIPTAEFLPQIAIHFDLLPNFPLPADDLAARKPYQIGIGPGLTIAYHRIVTNPKATEKIFGDILALHEQHTPISQSRGAAKLLDFLLTLLVPAASHVQDTPHAVPADTARLNTVLRYIAEHFAEPLTVQQLADMARLSPSRFSELFTIAAGQSPAHYVRHIRIERARLLLTNYAIGIKEISQLCGFSDPFHFSRSFRQVAGMPPSAYRQMLLRGGFPADSGPSQKSKN